MAPELFPSVPGAMSGMTNREAEDRVTEKVRPHGLEGVTTAASCAVAAIMYQQMSPPCHTTAIGAVISTITMVSMRSICTPLIGA
jgi:hypothetical protein